MAVIKSPTSEFFVRYVPHVLERTSKYIATLDRAERAAIGSSIMTLCAGDFGSVHTKQLAGPIRELIVGKYRLVYFVHSQAIYFTSGFMKKTQKTPQSEIVHAQRTYNLVNDL